MLKREVCEVCVKRYSTENKHSINADNTKGSYILCPHYSRMSDWRGEYVVCGVLKASNGPPETCPFLLEHTVS